MHIDGSEVTFKINPKYRHTKYQKQFWLVTVALGRRTPEVIRHRMPDMSNKPQTRSKSNPKKHQLSFSLSLYIYIFISHYLALSLPLSLSIYIHIHPCCIMDTPWMQYGCIYIYIKRENEIEIYRDKEREIERDREREIERERDIVRIPTAQYIYIHIYKNNSDSIPIRLRLDSDWVLIGPIGPMGPTNDTLQNMYRNRIDDAPK